MAPTIVCGIDGSEASLGAAKVAAGLADRSGGTLVLAHVLSGAFPYPRSYGESDSLFAQVESRTATAGTRYRVLYGAPAAALADFAIEEDAALLVVGSRGRGALKAALLGSVSSALPRTANRPVVIVPREAGRRADLLMGAYSCVVCGVDRSDEARGALRVAAELAMAVGVELVLVHAFQPDSASAAIPAPGAAPPIDYEALEARRREAGESLLEAAVGDVTGALPVRTLVARGDAASALDRAARDDRAVLIVVGTCGRGRLVSALLGSTSTRLAAFAATPVTVVSPGAALDPSS